MASNRISRRQVMVLGAAGAFYLGSTLPGAALNVEEARSLVGKLVGDINAVIASGKSEVR